MSKVTNIRGEGGEQRDQETAHASGAETTEVDSIHGHLPAGPAIDEAIADARDALGGSGESIQPGLFMKNRSETDFGELSRVAKMPVLLGARRARARDVLCRTSQGRRPEDVKQDGQIRGCSRFFMNDPG